MPSYLVTIRLSAETQGRATILAEAIASGQCEAVSVGLVRTRLESVVEDELFRTSLPAGVGSTTEHYSDRCNGRIGERICTLGMGHTGNCELGDPRGVPTPEGAVSALSPAVVEELRQMMHDVAGLVMGNHEAEHRDYDGKAKRKMQDDMHRVAEEVIRAKADGLRLWIQDWATPLDSER